MSPEAYPDKTYAGNVAEIAPEADRAKGTLQIKVQIVAPDKYLTPQLSAKVDFLKLLSMTKIAIVEDNRTIRESLAEFVQSDPENRCVGTRATAEEALKTVPKLQPDIILMDIQLPNLSGIECCAQLKQLLPAGNHHGHRV